VDLRITKKLGMQRGAIDWARARMAGRRPPYLVASMGRSGSTIVFEALVNGLALQRFGFLKDHLRLTRVVQSWAFDLPKAKLIGGVVYKTHDFPTQDLCIARPKIVYVFGTASVAAVSVYSCLERYGRAWIDRHFDHLRADGPFEEMWSRDVLRFGDQLEAWINVQGLDVLSVRYESLWDHEMAISDFVGFPVKLPPRRQRFTTAKETDVMVRATDLYSSLDARIEALPDVFRPPLTSS
jgi:hypothetical protein